VPVDWRDNLLPGSIGGAELFIGDVRTTVGRRVVVTELPGRDKPVNEDMGRAARRYAVTGFVIGDEYMAARDKVVAVLESEGPYDFVHRWQGPKSVVLEGPLEITESDTEGGWARLSFTIVESGEPDGLRILVSSASALAAAADAGIAAGAIDLAKGLKKVGIGSIFAAAANAVSKVSRTLMKAKQKVFGALGVKELTSLTDAITDLKDTAYALINAPAELMTTLSGLVASIMSVVAIFEDDDPAAAPYPGGAKAVRAEAALSAAQELSSVDTVTPPPFPGGPVDEDAQEAEKAIGKALRVAAVTNTAAVFKTLPLESGETAKAALAAVGKMAEQLLADETTSDELFNALTDLKAALDRHLAGLASSLPSVQTLTPAVTMPALLLAYQYYGDPTRDLEVCGRNRLRDPNFVRGGEPLEVLDA
jgi:prophage DNA circulation protein